jgi:FAD synthetase
MMKRSERRSKIVLAAGVFDLLHYGHLRFLEEAKKAGGKTAKLVVVVARDKTVELRKGVKPVLPEEQRKILVSALKPVNETILGFKNLSIDMIVKKVKPDIVAVGYDQDDMFKKVQDLIEREKLNMKVIQIGRFGPTRLDSSTDIKNRVIEKWKRPG